ncbi:alpha/beta fold hydrolase [Nocardioides coralli]|uniref:alpha/beta fold hydrolase n=1 Tax=Nocardioides coralli TaxID=2872154 RepID=UPI001CA437DD|nr:alpha/beta hydrolase [Nocardioides coralli]QZY30055.1 alpha/beta hydrolase [Nocardioides coralli]
MTDGWGRVERPDAEIWYHDTAGDLPVIVLLHGLAGYALEWGAVIAGLCEDFRVVSVEQRGHGSSTRRPADVSRTAYVADVVAVLDDLGVGAVPVVGHSLGGHTAMLLAAHHPDRVSDLVLVESGLGGGGEADLAGVAGWLRGWPVPFEDREEFLAFFGGGRSVAEGWADGLAERHDGLWPQWDPDTLVAALAPVALHEHLEEWSAVHAPTLLVRGEHGSVPERQVESMCALRPDTALAVIAGAGHDVHLEAAEALLPVLRRFLALRRG